MGNTVGSVDIKVAVLTRVARGAWDGNDNSVEAIAKDCGVSVTLASEIISEALVDGKIAFIKVLSGNPFTGSSHTVEIALPVIEGEPRGYRERHMFSRLEFLRALL